MTFHRRVHRIFPMKKLATLLLLFVTAIFIVSVYFEGSSAYLPWVRAFAEAAMIGALADWFAVTALFRHPLGLPIPHTAVIPSNKNRIGKELGSFIENNFLSTEILISKLENFDFSAHLCKWFRDSEFANKLSERLSTFLYETLKVFDDQKVRMIFEENLVSFISRFELAPAAGNILNVAVNGPNKEELVHVALNEVEKGLSSNKDILAKFIKDELPWWVPGFVHDKIYGEVFKSILKTLKEVSRDPEHEIRKRIILALDKLIDDLKNNPEYLAKGEKIKRDLLSSDFGSKYFKSLANDLKEQVSMDLQKPESILRKNLILILAMAGDSLQRSPELRERLNTWCSKVLLDLGVNYRKELSGIIYDTVSEWDAQTISNKIESQIGRDLQFIRINGTLVGGAIGLLIHAVQLYLR